jgi:hypothetical protein
MALIEDEHVVQAFSAQRSHPALGDRVCLWRPERRADLGDPEGPHPSVKDRTIAPVTIVDEKARWLPIPAAALDDLPACPFGRRMPRRLDVENFPVGVINNEEHIKRMKEDRPHAEEVAGPNRRRVLLEERAPTRRRLAIPRTTHILSNGPRRDPETKPCQLRLDPPLTP